ncbi:MAG: phosphoglycerate kinase [Candidatus Shapirobacteria bacterium]|nr:phosphoglycerate kinase [Candidatus Shapirobacteria bacterium]
MNLRSVSEILPNTRVILRMDLDVAEGDDSRLVKSIPTIKLLLGKQCKIAIIGHRGRPESKDESLSLKSVYLDLMSLLEPDGENLIESVFIEDVGDKEKIDQALAVDQIVFLENLRFWKGEENNDPDFLKGLVEMSNFYVDDAFAVAHRKHRSIMLYKNLPGFYGLSFIEEAEKIAKVAENPEKPLTVILGGAKEDKLKYLEELEKKADKILIGGKLPKLLNPSPASQELPLTGEPKIVVAKLREDGLDLSDEDINKFKEIIKVSKTIIWAGAMGLFENALAKKGTEEIAKAVAASNAAYKIIAGGDTGASIRELGLEDKIDYVCSGGGVMLELLTKGKLPAWE